MEQALGRGAPATGRGGDNEAGVFLMARLVETAGDPSLMPCNYNYHGGHCRDSPFLMKTREKDLWLGILATLVLSWCATIALFLSGVFSYPWGWLVLLVLVGWAWFRMRESD